MSGKVKAARVCSTESSRGQRASEMEGVQCIHVRKRPEAEERNPYKGTISRARLGPGIVPVPTSQKEILIVHKSPGGVKRGKSALN